MKRKTLTIFFADVQGYTIRTGRQTREQNETFVKEIRDFVESNITEKGGIFIKSMGDGFLGSFESPTDAVACGVQMQKRIQIRNSNVLRQDNFIRFRIGISTGEVTIDESGDVFGDAVNIAARIEKFAAPNDVYISEATYLAMNKSEVKTQDLGPQKFKNVLHEVRVYKVFPGMPDPDNLSESSFAPSANQKMTLSKKILLPVVFIAVVIILFIIFKGSPLPLNQGKNTDIESEEYKPDIEKLMNEGNFGPIIGWAESKLEKNIQDIQTHELLAEIFKRMQDWPQAEFHLQNIIEFAPEESFPYLSLADIYEVTERKDQAIIMLAEYINREPNQYNRKKALNRMKDIERQIKEAAAHSDQPHDYEPDPLPFRQENFSTPSHSENHQNNVFADTGEKWQNTAASAEAPNIGRLMQEENYPPIIDWAQEELNKNPQNISAHELLIRVYMKTQDWGQAQMHLEELIHMLPENKMLYFKLALLQEKSGQIDQAIHTLRLFINQENNPQQKEKAFQKIKRLERRKNRTRF